jgi:hypothetical protein
MSEILYDHSDNPPDYFQKIADFLTLNYPDVILPERTARLMVKAFDEAYRKYGSGQTDITRRAYHNDEHAYEVFERAVAWLKRFEEHFGATFTTEDYEVVGLAASHHDIVVGANDESGLSDESLSAKVAIDAMRQAPEKFSAKMRRRVTRAIESTTVEYRNDGVFQTSVMQGKPDFAVVAVALADSSAVITENEDKIIEDVSKLALERLPAGATDVTVVTESVMKILGGEEKFVNHRLDDLTKYLEFLSDSAKADEIVKKYFAKRRKHVLRFTARIDSRLGEIQNAVTETLNDSIETTEGMATKIYRGIQRGLAWLPPVE